MKDDQGIRESVSKAYAKAVTSGGVISCGDGPVQKGVLAKLAGYDGETLSTLPDSAVVNSFGCGNPLAYSEVKLGDVVLDLGSGAGIDILIAARTVGPIGHVIGIDMTDEMIAKAEKNIAASGLSNVEVRKGIIEDLPVDASSVDWVISNCVINLSPEKDRVFAEIARVLKTGGRMLVSDIVVKDLPELVLQSQALYNSCIAGAISEETYVEGLRNAGLEEVDVRERLIYDATQLQAFISSELEGRTEASSCWNGQGSGVEAMNEITTAMVGKVWSVKVGATKP
jgi:SAM-dependent methyltransferase